MSNLCSFVYFMANLLSSKGDTLSSAYFCTAYAVYTVCLKITPSVSNFSLPLQRGGGFAAQKGSQPRLASLGSPFQGKGLAWTLPPSYGRRCPEGAEVGWGKRYEREGDCLKYVVYESTRAPLRGPPSPMGKATIRGCRFSRIVKANTGYMEKKNNDGQSLPRVGNAIKLSKILIAHASNSVCFFHPLSLLVNNKIKKLVK